ncbi:PREDICTED: myb/SANT-like DNA-binding domain-containing protein 3 [Rhagoletis zephyria]|uniref:myb/SANT-like DNA-binding domain-containing protein 3 n=1 Tax=Rhagoletis zephyria TaxID=28612 RepID=UPI00081162F1|nr:PREDICTED: myb/SANT-like DNA-binding domain-containing protein 3 [Rhagoletis zephyria]
MAKRSNNFSAAEIESLLEIVEKHKKIIECKKSDAVTTLMKNKEWKTISEEFNSGSSASFRDEKVLKTKYYNLKKEMRKKAAFNKRSLCGTGGGPLKEISVTNVDMKLREIMGAQQIKGMEASYDCDQDSSEQRPALTYNDEVMIIEKLESPETVLGDDDGVQIQKVFGDDSEQVQSADDYQPISLRSTKNKKLRVLQNPAHNNISWSKLATIKANWSEKKSRVEIDLLQEEHEKKMMMLQRQIEQNEIEHEMRMAILRKRNKEMDLKLNKFEEKSRK